MQTDFFCVACGLPQASARTTGIAPTPSRSTCDFLAAPTGPWFLVADSGMSGGD